MSVTWTGLAELKDALRALPVTLRDDAKGIVDNAAQVTFAQTYQSYPLGATGNLRAGLKVIEEIGAAGITDVVLSMSPHAHLWEFGTVNRTTLKGWNRGREKPSRDMGRDGLIPIAIRNRRVMYVALIAMVTEHGFTVSGDLNAVE